MNISELINKQTAVIFGLMFMLYVSLQINILATKNKITELSDFIIEQCEEQSIE